MTTTRISRLPIVLVGIIVVGLGTVFFTVSWPFVDAYNFLYEASRWTWRQYFHYAFGGATEYRPLLMLALKLGYEVAGLQLWFFQALVLAQFAAALGLLVWLFHPDGKARAIAACIALLCLVALHTSRVLFLFVPLNAYSAVLVFVLLAVALAVDPRGRALDWVYFPLTLVSALLLESGLLIPPLVLALWWARAPGVGRRGVAATCAAVVAYLAVRFTFGAVAPAVYAETGLGFSVVDASALRAIFEHAPWVLWIYNGAASFLTVVASEPRAGVFQFVAAILAGETPVWMWWHVGSSLLSTALIVWALAAYRPATATDRLLLVTGVVLVVFGSALGFLYTRDRIPLYAGVGYSILLYLSIAGLLERERRWAGRLIVVTAAGLVAVLWTVRSGEIYYRLRDNAWSNRLEWTERLRAADTQPDTALFASMRTAALRIVPDDPRGDPAWSYALFERVFASDRRAPPTVFGLSAPFNIRWTPAVDDDSRLRFEAELGLTDPQRVERDERGRTWTYRLRRPTPDRVRTILSHPGVEDTARIDTERLEVMD